MKFKDFNIYNINVKKTPNAQLNVLTINNFEK